MSNQDTIYKEGVVCGNTKFRYCDVSTKTHECINCEKPFTDDLKDGDHITGRCDECGQVNIEIVIHTRYVNGGVVGDCVKCTENGEAISELYSDYRGGYDESHDMAKELEKIASLPHDQLIHFLRAIHYTVER